MIEKVRLVYIDDNIDNLLTAYLQALSEELDFQYDEREFNTTENYDNLIKDNLVKLSNIVLIDSQLFENMSVGEQKFSGEEFRLLLTKEYPYKKVFIVSQNDDEKNIGYISKSIYEDYQRTKVHYDGVLLDKIKNAIKEVKDEKMLLQGMVEKEGVDLVMLEKISNSIRGVSEFDALTKEDIDKVIEMFNKLNL